MMIIIMKMMKKLNNGPVLVPTVLALVLLQQSPGFSQPSGVFDTLQVRSPSRVVFVVPELASLGNTTVAMLGGGVNPT